ncbi:MFS transporter [Halobacillus litoralis]|uniref:MFS transporter n=1 Tax=Halobacillus litoralis TaxID=45668 RepID=UPI00273FDDD3|nr:MFS transporter [Halobacillus litoralis]WLR48816.1 MFS transporter [Halobacillus litoralis]
MPSWRLPTRGVLSFVSVYANQLGLAQAASYFFVVYALVLLVSRPFTGRWFDQYGENVIVIPSILTFGAGMLILSFANTAFVLLLAGGLIGLGWGTLVPSMQTIALKKSTRSSRLSYSHFLYNF